MGLLNFPFPRGVIQRIPDPERDAVGVFPQFGGKVADCVPGFGVLQGGQRGGLQQCGRQGIEAITSARTGSRRGYRPPPQPDPLNGFGLR
jgi:hypothetical protein